MYRFIEPDIFKKIPHIKCCFTEANRDASELNAIRQTIPGLNFGLNSDVPKPELHENYQTLLEPLGWNHKNLAIARQIHSDSITPVHRPGIYDQTDGLITTKSNISLGIQVADCAAVLVADGNPDNPVIGAFHAGWRGALSGIIPKGINKMVQHGGDTNTIRAYISPCISIQNFEVGFEVASEFPEEYCDYESYDKPHIDLKRYIYDQLIDSGLKEDHVECSPFCTISDDRFYSYRRERKKSGRMLGLIKYINRSNH